MKHYYVIGLILGWLLVGATNLYASDAVSAELFTMGMEAVEDNDCQTAIEALTDFLAQNQRYVARYPVVEVHINTHINYCKQYQEILKATGGGGKGDDWRSETTPSIQPPPKPPIISLTKLVRGMKTDAALLLETNGKTYTFTGRKYSRYSRGNKSQVDKGYPTNMPGGWQNLPSTWNSGIDAAIFFSPNGKSYFFKGNQYVRLSHITVDTGYPTRLPGGWEGLPKEWNKGINAALYFEPNGKSYFFRGNQYVRLTGTKVDAGYPANLPGGWKGLPSSFSKGIDAASSETATPIFSVAPNMFA